MGVSKHRVLRKDMSELRNLGLLLGTLLIGNRLYPSLFHILSHLVLSRCGDLKFAIKPLFRYVQKEEIQTSELRDSLLYSLMSTIIRPDLNDFGVRALIEDFRYPRVVEGG